MLHTSTHFLCLLFLKKYIYCIIYGRRSEEGASPAPPDPKGRLLPLRRSEKEKGESSDLKKTKKSKKKLGKQDKQRLSLSLVGIVELTEGRCQKTSKSSFAEAKKKISPNTIRESKAQEKSEGCENLLLLFLLESSAIFMCV